MHKQTQMRLIGSPLTCVRVLLTTGRSRAFKLPTPFIAQCVTRCGLALHWQLGGYNKQLEFRQLTLAVRLTHGEVGAVPTCQHVTSLPHAVYITCSPP